MALWISWSSGLQRVGGCVVMPPAIDWPPCLPRTRLRVCSPGLRCNFGVWAAPCRRHPQRCSSVNRWAVGAANQLPAHEGEGRQQRASFINFSNLYLVDQDETAADLHPGGGGRRHAGKQQRRRRWGRRRACEQRRVRRGFLEAAGHRTPGMRRLHGRFRRNRPASVKAAVNDLRRSYAAPQGLLNDEHGPKTPTSFFARLLRGKPTRPGVAVVGGTGRSGCLLLSRWCGCQPFTRALAAPVRPQGRHSQRRTNAAWQPYGCAGEQERVPSGAERSSEGWRARGAYAFNCKRGSSPRPTATHTIAGRKRRHAPLSFAARLLGTAGRPRAAAGAGELASLRRTAHLIAAAAAGIVPGCQQLRSQAERRLHRLCRR
jgi:hypothetical protein